MHILLVNNKPIAISENVELLKQRAYSYYDNISWITNEFVMGKAHSIEIIPYNDQSTTFIIEPIEYLSTQE